MFGASGSGGGTNLNHGTETNGILNMPASAKNTVTNKYNFARYLWLIYCVVEGLLYDRAAAP
jgi:hypothetical protein